MTERERPTRRIGGGDIPKLLGLSPYGDALDVYERIVLGKESEWNPKMERGQAIEPVLRAHAQRVLGLELEDTESDYHARPDVDFAWAQIDDLGHWQGVPACIDYKSVSRFARGWGPPGSDTVPPHIHAQMAWELYCSGRELGVVIAGFGDDRPPPEIFCLSNVITYEIERDEEFERFAVMIARHFWTSHVLARVPPTIERKRKKKAS